MLQAAFAQMDVFFVPVDEILAFALCNKANSPKFSG
jgi:hypothetical protein